MKVLVIFLSFVCILEAFMPGSPGLSKSNSFTSFMNRIRLKSQLNIATTDIKNGMFLLVDNIPFEVTEFTHVQPGRLSSFVRTKIKNLKNKNIQEKTFRAGDKLIEADIKKVWCTYSYTDGSEIVFMDKDTFEEIRVQRSKIEDVACYLLDEMIVQVLLWNDEVIGVLMPNQAVYKIKELNAGSGQSMSALLHTGITVHVPAFLHVGDSVIVTTADGKYVGKAQT